MKMNSYEPTAAAFIDIFAKVATPADVVLAIEFVRENLQYCSVRVSSTLRGGASHKYDRESSSRRLIAMASHVTFFRGNPSWFVTNMVTSSMKGSFKYDKAGGASTNCALSMTEEP